MIDSTELSPGSQHAAVNTTPSPGKLLRRARESAGMHIGTLAVMLKVPVKKLEALESDRWDLLPDAVFVRALAASVCRTLKVDPTEVLEHLPVALPKLTPNSGGVNASYRTAPGPGAGVSLVSQLSRPLGLAVLALLLAALGLVFWPGLQAPPVGPGVPGGPMTKDAGIASPAPAIPIDSVAANTAASPASAPIVGDARSPDSTSTALSSPSVAVAAQEPATVPVESANSKAESQVLPDQTMVVFKTTGPSWVQVTDARGVVVLKKLMGAGESAAAAGVLPLAVLVGRVDATTVEIRGKPFDMTAVARDNVARFEVKP